MRWNWNQTVEQRLKIISNKVNQTLHQFKEENKVNHLRRPDQWHKHSKKEKVILLSRDKPVFIIYFLRCLSPLWHFSSRSLGFTFSWTPVHYRQNLELFVGSFLWYQHCAGFALSFSFLVTDFFLSVSIFLSSLGHVASERKRRSQH